jgi:hypothetical protein
MVVGHGAREQLWQPLLRWIEALPRELARLRSGH